ncbi:MAG: glycosyltransferase family 2 protein [Verrucomicrobiia bacterium]
MVPTVESQELEVTVLMPCLNEAGTVAQCVQDAFQGLESCHAEGEVLVTDNGSCDGSVEVAKQAGARVVTVGQRGYGSALRSGIAEARGRFVVIGDADGTYDFKALGPFIAALRNGADLVMGCRFPSGGGVIERGAMPWKHRWIGNPVLSWLGRCLFRTKCRDFHCGLRGLNRERFARLPLRTTGMEFASEMVIRAALAGYRIEEAPARLRPALPERRSHLRSWRDGWRHLRFMLLFAPDKTLTWPGAVLATLGSVVFVSVLPGALPLGRIKLDLNTMEVAGLAMLFGFQMMLFGSFAKLYAQTRGLLPSSLKQPFWARHFSLERGLLIAGGLLLCGLILIGVAVWQWAKAGFGDLDPFITTRLVILGRITATLGGLVALFSFMFSYLLLDSWLDHPKGDGASQ